jgi:hypothetical protein
VDSQSWKILKAQNGQLGMTALSMPDHGSELGAPTNSTAHNDVVFNLGLCRIITYLLLDSRPTKNAVPIPPIKGVAWFVHHPNFSGNSQTNDMQIKSNYKMTFYLPSYHEEISTLLLLP